MNYVYIGGDSFCYYRQNQDWPTILANSLDLGLKGRGFPGDSWWHSRKHLLNYCETESFTQTKLFVFCHTDPFRILTGQTLFKNLMADDLKEKYFKYFVDYEVSLWTVARWYEELNSLLKDKQVLHLRSFDSNEDSYNILNGIRVTTPLYQLSMNSSIAEDFMNDSRRNHFDLRHNHLLAQKLLECLQTGGNDLEISFQTAAAS